MNWTGSGETVVAMPELAEPQKQTRTRTQANQSEGDWLCALCHNRVANERNRFCFDGKDEFTFSNPAGFRFDIITFLETDGCRQTGALTLEHTWFPGHAWTYCQCGECGQHLGWFFEGKHHFVGLIKARIVRALYLRN